MSRQDPHEEFGTNERGFPNRYPDDPAKQAEYEYAYDMSVRIFRAGGFASWPRYLQTRFLYWLDWMRSRMDGELS